MLQSPTPEEVATALERVYARREFVERDVPALVQWLRDMWAAIRNWIGEFLFRLIPESSYPLIAWIIIGTLSVIAAVALIILVRAIATPRTRNDAPAPTFDVVRAHTAEWWEQAARKAAAERRFRDAALALYCAAVVRLDHAGILRYQSGKTPGDYRREVPTDAAARPSFDRFIRELMPVAFGPQEPDALSFERLRNAASSLGVHA